MNFFPELDEWYYFLRDKAALQARPEIIRNEKFAPGPAVVVSK